MKTKLNSTELEKVLLTQKIKTIVTDSVLNKIKYLCQKISKVEWSGILLYSFEGSIKEPETMIITLQDIIPMNKGTQAYTEYEFNEPKRDNSGFEDKYIDYIEENEHALEWNMAHIHSHNSMAVFFSGTDMSELNDNSASHNFYLSFIVNNFMDFQAKIAFRANIKESITAPYMALDENGIEYKINESTFFVNKEKLFIYDCDIISNKETFVFDDFFLNATQDIIDKADVKIAPTFIKNQQNSYQNKLDNNFTKTNNINHKQTNNFDSLDNFLKNNSVTNTKQLKNFNDNNNNEFIIQCLIGEIPEGIENIKDALDYLKMFQLTDVELANYVLEELETTYEEYFDTEIYTSLINRKKFETKVKNLIESLEVYQKEYPELKVLINELKIEYNGGSI